MTEFKADITIVGLGPGEPARRTLEVQAALDGARKLILRTARHPGIEDLVARDGVVICDDLAGKQPGEWSAAARLICDIASGEPVVVAVPGHPRFGERLVIETVSEANRRELRADILDGLSVVDLMSTALGLDPLVYDVQIIDAQQLVELAGNEPFNGGLFPFTPLRPMLFSRVYGIEVAAALSRILQRVLPPDHPVVCVDAAGINGEEALAHTRVGQLADAHPGRLASLWVPPLDRLEAYRDPRTLQHIVARLRAPDGCPWDRKQTNQTLRNSLVDEVYEAADAIDASDMSNLAEELGDLFLLIAMHAQIAEEAGHFTLEDVFEGISTKIIRRHPHVFGDRDAHDPEDVIGIWRKVKAEEKANGKTSTKAPDGQPHSMPALERAKRVLHKHPLDSASVDQGSPGERLLAAVAGIIDAGDDPDTALRAALERHVRES